MLYLTTTVILLAYFDAVTQAVQCYQVNSLMYCKSENSGEDKTFDNAQAYCQSVYGTDLATIGATDGTDDVELAYTTHGGTWAWIGLSRSSSTSNDWGWEDGSVFSYTNWDAVTSEPNGDGACAHTWDLDGSTSNRYGTWNDLDCTNARNGWFCNVPPPTSRVQSVQAECIVYSYNNYAVNEGTESGPFVAGSNDYLGTGGTPTFPNDGVQNIIVYANSNEGCTVNLWSGCCGLNCQYGTRLATYVVPPNSVETFRYDSAYYSHGGTHGGFPSGGFGGISCIEVLDCGENQLVYGALNVPTCQ